MTISKTLGISFLFMATLFLGTYGQLLAAEDSGKGTAAMDKAAKKAVRLAGFEPSDANVDRALSTLRNHASELRRLDADNERQREMSYASAVLVANAVSFAVIDLTTKAERVGRGTSEGRAFIEIARKLNAAGLQVMEAVAPDGHGRPSASREQLIICHEELKRNAVELAPN